MCVHSIATGWVSESVLCTRYLGSQWNMAEGEGEGERKRRKWMKVLATSSGRREAERTEAGGGKGGGRKERGRRRRRRRRRRKRKQWQCVSNNAIQLDVDEWPIQLVTQFSLPFSCASAARAACLQQTAREEGKERPQQGSVQAMAIESACNLQKGKQ